jgi:hypothetical protein
MIKLLSIAAIGATLALAAPASGNAAPLTPQQPGAQSAIEPVHGYHRGCRRGHRHDWDGDRHRCGYHRGYDGPRVHLHIGRDRHHHRGHRHHHHRGHGHHR